MDGESNESIYKKFGCLIKMKGINIGMVEVINCITRWFGHLRENRRWNSIQDLQEWSGCCECEMKIPSKNQRSVGVPI